MLAALFPQLAFAANLFDPSSGDISMKVLKAIFGGLMDGGGSDPMMAGIKAFNGGVLMIGGVLAAYTVLSATIGTAHDGQFMGKSYHSAWLPLRYAAGTAVVLPVIGGGYCVMQAIVMWLVVQGIGLADSVWSSFMSNPTSTANTTATTTNRDAINKVARTAFINSVCYRAYNQAATNDVGGILGWVSKYQYAMSPAKDSTGKAIGYVYGDANSSFRVNGCGVVNYPELIQADSTINNNSVTSTNQGYLGNIGTIFAPMDVSSINTAHQKQTDTLVATMDKLAGEVIDKRKTGPLTVADAKAFNDQIEAATDAYVTGIKTSVGGLAQTDAYAQIKKSATDQGWMLGGAWFTRIVQMNGQIFTAINSTPTADRHSPVIDGALFGDASAFLNSVDEVLGQSKEGTTGNTFNTEQNQQTASNGKSEDVDGWMKKAQAAVMKGLTGVNLYQLKNDPRHPLIIIQDLGERLENATWIIMGALASAALASGLLSLGAVNGAISVMGWFVNVPIKLLMGSALGAQYILPNMPFIIWVGCIVGWVLLVIEAIIAAPMWAIMHLHPSGQSFADGKPANGYSLMLSLLLRPVLMVFGLMASLVISAVLGEFINKVYFEVFAQATNSMGGFSALTALAMGTCFYVIIMFIFIRKCFGLMHQLPDQMLQWFGGQGAGLGQFAGDFAGAADKGAAAASAAGGAAASAAGGAAGSLAGGFGKKIAKERENMSNEGGAKATAFNALAARTGMGNMKGSLGEDGRYRNAAGRQSLDQARQASAEKEMNGRFGSQASTIAAAIASRLQGSDKTDFNNSYTAGLNDATAMGGEAGKESFMSQMEAAHETGFAAHGGSASRAADSIGQKIVSSGIASSGLSSGAQSYVQAAAVRQTGPAAGSISGRMVQQAMSDVKSLNKMAAGKDSAGVDAALQKAATAGGDATTMRANAINFLNDVPMADAGENRGGE
ncbi:DotA/TraY family protein [Pandoraea communis]|uniref:DotA/TraY family protein n=1 Tax=Pandoraea communis TaxID=2508297 RepID=UPI0025A640B8|nr:DotA/TraY family protein [Pandoraea communis]MDM8356182.1 DotA/TraY family protein [Pandoraea communis]